MNKIQIFHIIQVVLGLLIPKFPFPILMIHIPGLSILNLLGPVVWFIHYLIVGILIVLLFRAVKFIPALTVGEIAFFAVPYIISAVYFTYKFI